MATLEDAQGFVDKRQHVHAHRLCLLLELNGGVELFNGLWEVALIKEKLAEVVIDIRDVGEVLDATTESSHRGCYRAHLVLRHTKLNVREDELTVQINRLLVVLLSFSKLSLDEVELRAMIVNIGICAVLSYRLGKILLRLVRGT